jgi:hypothetical protein
VVGLLNELDAKIDNKLTHMQDMQLK